MTARGVNRMHENAGKNAYLKPKQRAAIDALMKSRTNKEAATMAGVSERQLYVWLKNPIFRSELMAAETAAREVANRMITIKTTEALDVIAATMEDPDASPSVRLAAAKSWLDYFFKAKDDGDLDRRLTDLEARVYEEKGGKW